MKNLVQDGHTFVHAGSSTVSQREMTAAEEYTNVDLSDDDTPQICIMLFKKSRIRY